MSEITPITREEQFLDGNTDLTPITRQEMFIKHIYDASQEVPTPITREEMFLKKAADTVHGIEVESLSVTDNGIYIAPSGKAYTPVNVNVPLPANAYLLTAITDGDITSAKSKPLPSVSVAVTDADELDVFVGDSGTIVSDNEPYLYRQSKGGRMVSERLVGASVARNQLVENGNFETADGWEGLNTAVSATANVLTVTATEVGAQAALCNFKGIVAHKYLATFNARANTVNHELVSSLNKPDISKNTLILPIKLRTSWMSLAGMCSYVAVNAGDEMLRIAITSGTALTVGDYIQIKNVQIHDLTLMFGSAIADYVYSLEQSTAGSGIAWLKSYGFFTEDYYAYDSGSLKSVSVSEKKVVGFNQWDEQWEVGGITDSNGQDSDATDRIRTKNYMPILSQTTYYRKNPENIVVYFYDINKNFISNSGGGKDNAFTTPANATYFRFRTVPAYGTTYNNDICINISDPNKNGTYEPYKLTTYPLPSSDLRGLYKLASNKLQADGDIQYGDGWRLRRYGIVDLGTLGWSYMETVGKGFYTDAIFPTSLKNSKNLICAKYVTVNGDDIYDGIAENMTIGVASNGRLRVKDTSYTDATTFKTAMNGVYLIYELATPTWEKTNPFTNPQTVGSTEEFVANLPVGHESKYYDGDIHHSYIYSGDARAKVTGDVDIVNGTAPNGTCSVCVVMPDGDEIWSDAGDVTAEIWT